jgi:hypothetical protein
MSEVLQQLSDAEEARHPGTAVEEAGVESADNAADRE